MSVIHPDNPGIRVSTSARSIGENSMITLVGQVVLFLLSLIISVVTARLLGVAGRGVYSLTILIFSWGTLLVGFGVPVANRVFVGKGQISVPVLLGNSLLYVAVSVLIVLVAGSWLANPLGKLVNLQPAYVFLAAALVPVGLLANACIAIVHGSNDLKKYNWLNILGQALTLVLLIGLTGVGRMGLGGALVGLALAQALMASAAFVSAFSAAGRRLAFGRDALRKTLAFGAQGYPTYVIGALNFRFDMLLVASFLGVKEVGFYSVAVPLASLLWFVPSALGLASLPRLSRSTSVEEVRRVVNTGARMALWSSVGIAAVLGGAGFWLLPLLYGADFESARGSFLLLLPGSAAYSVASITTAYFDGYIARPIINGALAGLSLIIDVGLVFLFVPSMGLKGVALASSLAYIASMTVGAAVYLRMSGSTAKDMLLIKSGDVHRIMHQMRAVVGSTTLLFLRTRTLFS